MESKYKSKWRKHFTVSEEKSFSRLKRIVKAMKAESERSGDSLMDICIGWNEIYDGECKRSLSKMEEWMKKQGIIITKSRKGKPQN